MKKLMLAAALCTAAAPAFAESYTFDPHHTFPHFEINHLGLSTFHGQFDETSGTATIDPVRKTGSVDVNIAVKSIATGVPALDEHLQGADFFDAAKYPTITFKSTDFTFVDGKPKTVKGLLTMHGVTKPVTLTVTSFVCKEHPLEKKPACGADLEGTLKRSDWGVSAYVPLVGDDVRMSIEVEATQS